MLTAVTQPPFKHQMHDPYLSMPHLSSGKEKYLHRWLLGSSILLSCPPSNHRCFESSATGQSCITEGEMKQLVTWQEANSYQNKRVIPIKPHGRIPEFYPVLFKRVGT